MVHFRLGRKAVTVASLLLTSLFPTTLAQNSSTPASSAWVTDDFSFAINVPEGAGLTDLYFSLQAPAKHTWAAFGIGMLMQNSLMFVVYRSADDKGEPTVSPRLTKNHDMPEYHNETVVNVLEGSEVTNDNFIAHIHCKNCRSWDGGNLDENAVKGRFFYALGPEGSLTSDDINAKIEKHSDTPVQFKVDVKAAIGTNGVPSFTSTNSSNTKFNSGDGDLPGFSNGQPSMILAFHAFVLCFAFTIIYPVGYLLLRLFERVWLHWGLQSFGTLFVFMGVGSGIAISKREDISPNLTHPHQIIGLLTFIVVLAAMTLGAIGHISYKKKGLPSPLMKGHRIAGPLAITLGFVNACIGLAWSGKTRAIIGYVVFDLLVFIVIGGLVFMKKKRNARKNVMNTAAARNFRDVDTGYSHVRTGSMPNTDPYAAPPAYGNNEQQVPLQTFHGHEQRVEHYSVGPNK